MRMKVYGGRFHVNSGRAKYNYYPESKIVVDVINTDVILGSDERLYTHFIVGKQIIENLWLLNTALYGLVGGTANTHKWNWKNMTDTNPAFRINWFGTVYHDGEGIQGDGTTGYGDTNISPSSILTINNTSLNIFINDGNPFLSEIEIGASDNNTNTELTLITGFGGASYSDQYNKTTNRISFPNSEAKGFYIGNRDGQYSHNFYKNGALMASSNNESDGSLPLKNLNILRYNYVEGFYSYSSKKIGFISIGSSLNYNQVLANNNIISFSQKIRS